MNNEYDFRAFWFREGLLGKINDEGTIKEGDEILKIATELQTISAKAKDAARKALARQKAKLAVVVRLP